MNAIFKYAAMASISTLIFVHTASAQQADDVDALQRRMNSLESKVDLLIGLMQKQQNNQQNTAGLARSTSVPRPTKSNAPDGFVPGLYLDVYASGTERFTEEVARRDSLPAGFPSASVAIEAESSFQYGELAKHPETKNFAVSGDYPPAVVYSGYLMINESGKHAIGVNTKTRGSRCSTKLLINDKILINRVSRSDFDSENAALNLNSGLYKFQIYFRCSGHATFKYDGHQIDLVMAGPQERAPKPISADLLFIKQ